MNINVNGLEEYYSTKPIIIHREANKGYMDTLKYLSEK